MELAGNPRRGAAGSGTIEALTAHQTLRAAAARTAALLRTAQDPDAAVPGLSWTVGETAAHLVAELRHYAAFVTGERDAGATLAQAAILAADAQTPAQRNAVANAAQLAEFTERDLSRLADMMVPAAEDFIMAAGRRRADDRILTTNGLFMTAPTMASALLGEQLIHGLDIARAVNRPWYISRANALQVLAGSMTMAPDYLDLQQAAGLQISYELHFRDGPRYRLVVEDGTMALTAPGQPADCRISADPVAFLLVGYGRTGQWSQIVRGKIRAGGRKPWLGFTFGRLVTSP
jgi:uncharacterized protein (TIGR03083 family)